MWEGMNKRKFPRVRYPCKIVVFKKGGRDRFNTRTENIGLGGVCVSLDRELNKFSLVELALYLEDSQVPIECDARIVWVVKNEHKFDTGIEFLNIKEKDLIRVGRIVEECLKEQSQPEKV